MPWAHQSERDVQATRNLVVGITIGAVRLRGVENNSSSWSGNITVVLVAPPLRCSSRGAQREPGTGRDPSR